MFLEPTGLWALLHLGCFLATVRPRSELRASVANPLNLAGQQFLEARMTGTIRKMRAALCMGLFLVFAVAIGAQTVTGSIRGTVTDPSGAAVPGGKITAVNINTGVQTTTTADKAG